VDREGGDLGGRVHRSGLQADHGCAGGGVRRDRRPGGGPDRWIHTAVTGTFTACLLHDKRGMVAFDAMGVLPAITGTAVHDGWKPYKTYTRVVHALCNAHHLRELAGVTQGDPAGQVWAGDLAALLRTVWNDRKQCPAEGATAFPADELTAYQDRYRQVIDAGHAANLPSQGRKRSRAQNLLHRLDTECDQVLRLAADWRVPFGNDTAEQAIRMAKIQIKRLPRLAHHPRRPPLPRPVLLPGDRQEARPGPPRRPCPPLRRTRHLAPHPELISYPVTMTQTCSLIRNGHTLGQAGPDRGPRAGRRSAEVTGMLGDGLRLVPARGVVCAVLAPTLRGLLLLGGVGQTPCALAPLVPCGRRFLGRTCGCRSRWGRKGRTRSANAVAVLLR
jgi:hypothetical protein